MTNLNTISADRANFAKALSFVKRCAVRHGTLPILGNVLIRANGNKAMIHATDLDRRITVTLPLTHKVNAVSMTLPAYKLDELTRKAKASSTVEMTRPDREASHAAINFGNLKITMDSLDVNDFPTMEMAKVEHEFSLPTTDLLLCLNRIRCAISTEETRYYLNGVYMHQHGSATLRFVATDGHRLTLADAKLPTGLDKMPGVLVHRDTVDDLLTLLRTKETEQETRVRIGRGETGSGFLVSFINGNVTILSKTIDGTFPCYDVIIPKNNDKVMVVNVADMMEAVKEVSCISSGRDRSVKLSMQHNRLTVSVRDHNVGCAERGVAVDYPSGRWAPMEIGFNANYLLDLLGCLTESEEATFKINDPGGPMIVTGERDTGFLALLMPTRV